MDTQNADFEKADSEIEYGPFTKSHQIKFSPSIFQFNEFD